MLFLHNIAFDIKNYKTDHTSYFEFFLKKFLMVFWGGKMDKQF